MRLFPTSPAGCVPAGWNHKPPNRFSSPFLCGEKNYPVPSGLMRTQVVRKRSDLVRIITRAGTRPASRACSTCGRRRLLSRGRPGEDERDSAINHQLPLFSHGPTTRQYPAIPGNTRTKVQFLAAYCRLRVRLLPRILFSCRVKSGRRPL